MLERFRKLFRHPGESDGITYKFLPAGIKMIPFWGMEVDDEYLPVLIARIKELTMRVGQFPFVVEPGLANDPYDAISPTVRFVNVGCGAAALLCIPDDDHLQSFF